jgi:polysaccharide export outer membrane protein
MPLRNVHVHAILLTLAMGAPACSGAGSYVWVDDLHTPPSTPASDYVIATGDVLDIRVLGHDELSDPKVRVRDDGRVAMPILGELNARGVKPSALRSELEARLKDYVKEPSVTVNVDEMHRPAISVLGEVSHPGTYPVEPGEGVAQVLAGAGGVTEFANRSRIFVVRTAPAPLRVRFTYDALTHGDAAAAAFVLRAGDVIVVE